MIFFYKQELVSAVNARKFWESTHGPGNVEHYLIF